jgi:hypothetical protein
MSHSDPRELQAFALVAGAVAGSKTSACNLETAAMPGVASGLQALQAPHVGGRMQGRGRLSAGGGGQGRACAHVCTRVPAFATWKKTKGDNHLNDLQGAAVPCNPGCTACSPCNWSLT